MRVNILFVRSVGLFLPFPSLLLLTALYTLMLSQGWLRAEEKAVPRVQLLCSFHSWLTLGGGGGFRG